MHMTEIVAIPRPMPFTSVLLTASSGHSPRSWTIPGFSCHRPLRKIVRMPGVSAMLVTREGYRCESSTMGANNSSRFALKYITALRTALTTA